MGPDELAEFGYAAFGTHLGWRTIGGEPLPPWPELGPRIRNALRVFAAVVAREPLAPLEDEPPLLPEDDVIPVSVDAPCSAP